MFLDYKAVVQAPKKVVLDKIIDVVDEGPHCDLTEWKHFDSERKELEISANQFLADSYSEKDWEAFIVVIMDELRVAVKKECGDRWSELIKDVKAPNEYPCGVSTSRIFIKIELSKKANETVLERIRSFEIPMGC